MTNRPLVERILRHATERQGSAVVAAGRLLSWPDLGEAVCRLTSRLETLRLRQDEPVAVLAERSTDYVVGLLAVMAAGGAFVPFDPATPQAHARRLAARAGIRFGVGTRARMPHLDVVVAANGAVNSSHGDPAASQPPADGTGRATGHSLPAPGPTGPPRTRHSVPAAPRPAGGPLAYGLFTSGTTGEPHLVGIEQTSVLALVDAFDDIAPRRSPVVSAGACPLIFDVSVWEMFSALCTGGTVVLLDEQQVRDPARLVEAWRQHRVTTAYCPPALLDAVADEEERRDDGWFLERLLTGVEPISQRTLARFLDRDPELAVVNGYGPTEATICCTFYRLRDVDRDDRRTPIGSAINGYQLRLVDPDLPGGDLRDVAEPADGGYPDTAVGEIVIGGVGLARGYLDDPELTRQRFVWSDGQRWYRTGDLGRWLPNGVIEFAGRRDYQIKVRGVRVELGDVEAGMLRCPGVRAAVPAAVPGPQGRRLVGFVVPDPAHTPPVTEAAVRDWLGAHLPDHLVPSRVILIDAVPVTGNGKVDRNALIDLARARSVGTDYVAPPPGRPATVARLWAEALGVDRVGMHDNFFDLGGDSVTAIYLARRICREFGVGGHPSALLGCGTVAQQTETLAALLDTDGAPAPAGSAAGEQALVTVGQEGLWFRQAADPDDLSFVLPVAIRVRGRVDARMISGAVDRLLAAHAALGTRIHSTDQGLRQDTVAAPGTTVLEPVAEENLAARLTERYQAAAARIATLDGPLVETEVVPVADGSHVILVVAHHLVIDGGSVPQLVTGLAAALHGRQPTGSPSSAPFARQQRHLLAGPAGQEARAHWAATLARLGEAVQLAPAGARDVRRRGRGAVLRRCLDPAAADAVADVVARTGATPFAVILAAVTSTAMRLSGQDDVVVATPVAVDRAHVEVADAVGYYVNLVPVRCRAEEKTTHADVLRQVSASLDSIRTHGWYPFEEMLSLIAGARGVAAERLVRLVVAQDVPPGLPLRTGDVELAEELVNSGVAKYELSVFVREAPGGQHTLVWEYDTHLYDLAAVQRMAAAVEDVLLGRDLTRLVLPPGRPRSRTVSTTEREHWAARLADMPPAPELPNAEPWAAPQRSGEETARLRALLPPDVTRELTHHAAGRGLTLSTVLLAAYAETVGYWSRGPRFALALHTADRTAPVVPLAVDLTEPASFAERARRIGTRLKEDLVQGLAGCAEALAEQAGRATEPMDLPVAFTLEAVENPAASRQVWLNCWGAERGDTLQLAWDVRADLLPGGLAADMFAAYAALLACLAADDAWDGPTPVRLPAAQAARRAEVNATAGPLPDALLHEPFLAQAAATPDATAVEAPGRNLTYRQLLRRATVVADRLAGLHAGEPVAVWMDKGWEQLVAVFGVLLAGGAYVPVDAAQPPARRDAVLADAGVRHVLTQSWLAAAADLPDAVSVTAVDTLPEDDRPVPARTAAPDDLAYVIYTSGSTGTPKGVMISHRAALNTIDDINRRYSVTADDRVIGIAALGFDLSVYDVFGTLAVGGTLVLPEYARRADPAHWVELLERGVTVWNSVPGQLQMLCDWLRFAPAVDGARLRLALLSGDWIPVALPDDARALFPGLQIIGLGGATEGAIWSIAHPIGEVDTARPSIPYGKPLTNQYFAVLDHAMRPRPEWVTGELYIGGAGVALGYLNDEARTAARFVTDPANGSRIYRTGDLGRYLPDGTIEFLGREDAQVKIRGYRVELAEVEAAVQAHPCVGAAAVVVDDSGAGGLRLAAFVEMARLDTDGSGSSAGTAVVDAARQAAAGTMPDLDGDPEPGRSATRTPTRAVVAAVREVAARHPGEERLRLLHLGAGTGDVAAELVSALADLSIDYVVADASTSVLAELRQRFAGQAWVGYERFDADRGIREQGFLPNSFDVVVCAAEARPDAEPQTTVARMRELLAPGGYVLLLAAAPVRTGPPWREALTLHGALDVRALTAEQSGQHLLIARMKTDRAHATVKELIRGTASRLPEYMIPSAWQIVDAMPRTGNGKVDRTTLTALARTRPVSTGRDVPVQGRAATVARLWSDVLGVGQVGMQDNFFDLGGDSRSVAALVARLNDTFGTRMRVVDFMSAATVAAICGWLDTALAAPVGAPPPPAGKNSELRERVAQLAASRTRRRR